MKILGKIRTRHFFTLLFVRLLSRDGKSFNKLLVTYAPALAEVLPSVIG